MKAAIVTLVVATAVGGTVATSYGQEKLKSFSAQTPAGVHKEMPLAGDKAQAAEAPGQGSGPVKVGDAAVVPEAGKTIKEKARKE